MINHIRKVSEIMSILQEFEKSIVAQAEVFALKGNKSLALKTLRQLGLDAWGELLWNMPDHKYPGLSSILPKMSSESVQNAWTGTHGRSLLDATIPFVRYVLSVSNWRPNQISNFKVLDYGCGYGRISRLMMKYVEIDQIFGADPWDQSISLVHEAGFGENFKLTDYVPRKLPFDENSFDLIWAFSVFTHLSPIVAEKSLDTLSKYLSDDGVLVITLRPFEYWDLRSDIPSKTLKELRDSHYSSGSSFFPHNRSEVEGFGVTYGDTTISLEALGKLAPQFEILDIERCAVDPHQVYVTLKRK
jgi:SAM-dependent methyltransferase